MTATELRARFLEFFAARGHAIVPSASLLPDNDPTVLFTTAGMHPLVPFLLGEKHPAGDADSPAAKSAYAPTTSTKSAMPPTSLFSKCSGIGVWEHYFKKEAIEMSFEFLTRELKFSARATRSFRFRWRHRPAYRQAGATVRRRIF